MEYSVCGVQISFERTDLHRDKQSAWRINKDLSAASTVHFALGSSFPPKFTVANFLSDKLSGNKEMLMTAYVLKWLGRAQIFFEKKISYSVLYAHSVLYFGSSSYL